MHNKVEVHKFLRKLGKTDDVDQLESYSMEDGILVRVNAEFQTEIKLRELERSVINFSPQAEICNSVDEAVLRLMKQADLHLPADFVNKVLQASGHQI